MGFDKTCARPVKMHMKRFNRNRLPTYHDVGWSFPDGALSSFRELRLPDANIRLLDRRMHVKALNEAGRKLNELLHRAGRRNFQ